jgi:serine/threonine protein kinase
MARVRHPTVVPIYDVFLANDDPWIVMQYVIGRSLSDIVAKDNPMEERAIAAVGLAVLHGLSAAHKAGVIHRDVKPANILVTDDNSVYLVDFGIAKIVGDVTLTSQSNVVGTAEFLAPEWLRGEPVGPAADLWSLGVTLFYALEGYFPFVHGDDRTFEATLASILYDEPPKPIREGKLADAMLRLLHKDPAHRMGVSELATVFQAILERPTAGPRLERDYHGQGVPLSETANMTW